LKAGAGVAIAAVIALAPAGCGGVYSAGADGGPGADGAARGSRPVTGVSIPVRDRYARARLSLLDAINADRRGAGAPALALDSLATVAAQEHADAMAAERFFSHYGRDGRAPYDRLAETGSRAHVRENVFRWSRRLAVTAPGDPWAQFDVDDAQRWLMRSSGHRDAIVDPWATGVGLGIASDPVGDAVYVVQDFVSRHVSVEVTGRAWRGSSIPLRGRVLAAGLRPLVVSLSREPDDVPWSGGDPPGGAYQDGSEETALVPPWSIEWHRTDASFALDLAAGGPLQPGRWYGIVYLARDSRVERALALRSVTTENCVAGAAFVVDVL